MPPNLTKLSQDLLEVGRLLNWRMLQYVKRLHIDTAAVSSCPLFETLVKLFRDLLQRYIHTGTIMVPESESSGELSKRLRRSFFPSLQKDELPPPHPTHKERAARGESLHRVRGNAA